MPILQKSKPVVTYGAYLRFSERDDFLRIFITAEGREFLREHRTGKRDSESRRFLYDTVDTNLFYEMAEDFMGNGWEKVRPEQVGDLRDRSWMVITQEAVSADPNHDDELIVQTAYSFDRYIFDGYFDDMLTHGYVDWPRHDYLTDDEFAAAVAERRPDLLIDRTATSSEVV